MRENSRLLYPRLEAAIDLTVAALRTASRWLLRHHRAWVAGRARQELHAMSDRMLKDVGVKRCEIDRLLR